MRYLIILLHGKLNIPVPIALAIKAKIAALKDPSPIGENALAKNER